MIKQLDVIGLGMNAIEQVVRLPVPPNREHVIVCPPKSYEIFEGGTMANILTGLTRLGLKTGYLGKVGGDYFGIMITKACVNEGIDLNHCEILPEERSAWTWDIADGQGHRTHLLFPNVLTRIDEPYIKSNSYYIKTCRLLHIDISGLPIASCLLAAEIAKAEGIPIIVSLNISVSDVLETLGGGTKDELETLISFADCFISTFAGSSSLIDESDPLEIVPALQTRYLIPWVVLSHDPQGYFIATEHDTFYEPAFAVEPLDLTGLHDAFLAGITFGFFNEWNIRDTARFANAYRALNSLKIGPRSGMCVEAEVRQFLSEHEQSINNSDRESQP